MHRTAFALTLLAMALGACQQPPRPVADSPEAAGARAAIEAANTTTAESVARGDAQAVVAHYADDAMMLPAGSEAVRGRDAIRNHFQRAIDAGLKGLELDILSLDVGGDIAVETGSYDATDAAGNRMDTGKYVVAWRLENGAWKAYRDISTSSLPVTRASTPEAQPLPARCVEDPAATTG